MRQVTLDISNQDACQNFTQFDDSQPFDPDIMICVSDVENEEKGTQEVGYYIIFIECKIISFFLLFTSSVEK